MLPLVLVGVVFAADKMAAQPPGSFQSYVVLVVLALDQVLLAVLRDQTNSLHHSRVLPLLALSLVLFPFLSGVLGSLPVCLLLFVLPVLTMLVLRFFVVVMAGHHRHAVLVEAASWESLLVLLSCSVPTLGHLVDLARAGSLHIHNPTDSSVESVAASVAALAHLAMVHPSLYIVLFRCLLLFLP
jgi:hypothetical protein